MLRFDTAAGQESFRGWGEFRDKLEISSGQRIKPNSVDKAMRKITEIYKEDGYYNVEVTPSVVAPQDTIVRSDFARDIKFTINENEKYKLENIIFEGNKSFTDRKLRRAMSETKQKNGGHFGLKVLIQKLLKKTKTCFNNFIKMKDIEISEC